MKQRDPHLLQVDAAGPGAELLPRARFQRDPSSHAHPSASWLQPDTGTAHACPHPAPLGGGRMARTPGKPNLSHPSSSAAAKPRLLLTDLTQTRTASVPPRKQRPLGFKTETEQHEGENLERDEAKAPWQKQQKSWEHRRRVSCRRPGHQEQRATSLRGSQRRDIWGPAWWLSPPHPMQTLSDVP